MRAERAARAAASAGIGQPDSETMAEALAA
jgi:hypothetical protein